MNLPKQKNISEPDQLTHQLFGKWYITMRDVQERIDNDDSTKSVQLINYDNLMVVYASVLIDPKGNNKKKVSIEEPKKDSKGNWTITARITFSVYVLILAITYEKESQRAEAEEIINSVNHKDI